jgi:serine/threonine protein kinase
MTEFWPQCQNEVINGLYPLRRLLSGSDHSAVFITDCAAQDLATAAVKIVPAERVTLAQLSQWRTAAALVHPHLIRLLDTGLWQLGGRQFLFVVMEYADQTLSQVLLQRALSEAEVREMLPPVLDALAFIHQKALVLGQLKPANILVVDDQLKLASDTVRPSGESGMSVATPSLYDPPEAAGGGLSPAGDIWALGVTMVEALAQRLPASPDWQSVAACLPSTLAPAFVDTIQRCLSHNPASRPTATDLEGQCRGTPQTDRSSAPQAAVVSEAPRGTLAVPASPNPRSLASTILIVLVLLGAAWVGLRLFQSHRNSRQSVASVVQPLPRQSAGGPAATSQTPETSVPALPRVSAPSASPKAVRSVSAPPGTVTRRPDLPTQISADAASSVLHEQIPDASRSALETIHGHVKVAVLVIVGPSGDVIDALLENPGPSAYFARLARDAARKWKFAPADMQDSREWLLRFEFTRDGATAHADARRT